MLVVLDTFMLFLSLGCIFLIFKGTFSMLIDLDLFDLLDLLDLLSDLNVFLSLFFKN